MPPVSQGLVRHNRAPYILFRKLYFVLFEPTISLDDVISVLIGATYRL